MSTKTIGKRVKIGEVIEGDMPNRAAGMVHEWISTNRDELLEMWETQEFKKLDPLD